MEIMDYKSKFPNPIKDYTQPTLHPNSSLLITVPSITTAPGRERRYMGYLEGALKEPRLAFFSFTYLKPLLLHDEHTESLIPINVSTHGLLTSCILDPERFADCFYCSKHHLPHLSFNFPFHLEDYSAQPLFLLALCSLAHFSCFC